LGYRSKVGFTQGGLEDKG